MTFSLRLLLVLVLAGCGPAPFQDRTTLGILYRQTWSGNRYVVQADMVSGDLVATQNVRLSLRFQEGEVWVGAQRLSPGCVVQTLATGERLHFERARQVRLDAPARPCP